MLKGADRPREGMVATVIGIGTLIFAGHWRGGSAQGRPEHGVGGRNHAGIGHLAVRAQPSCPWPACWRSVSCS